MAKGGSGVAVDRNEYEAQRDARITQNFETLRNFRVNEALAALAKENQGQRIGFRKRGRALYGGVSKRVKPAVASRKSLRVRGVKPDTAEALATDGDALRDEPAPHHP